MNKYEYIRTGFIQSYFTGLDSNHLFDENGEPIRDIEFTDHDRPQNHPLPHQHKRKDNITGGTKIRGNPEPVSEWDYENE